MQFQNMLSKSFFQKFEPLAIYIWNTSQRLYISRTHIRYDKFIIAYKERSKYTTKLKSKQINEDFKVWGLAEYSYIWS
jgi:hypothetical protein